jgi:hypothetical protein
MAGARRRDHDGGNRTARPGTFPIGSTRLDAGEALDQGFRETASDD